ncbi:hypothetical protein ACOSP7_026929 [Xanthoceras sorbifolium]
MAASSQSHIENQTSQQAFFSPFNSRLNFNLPIKLDRGNYPFWRAQVLPAIRAYNLKDYIFASKLAPTKFVDVQSAETGEVTQTLSNEFLSWKKNNQLLVCWMISTLSPSVVGEVTQCVTAFEVWSTLEKLYSGQSKVSILHLRSQMQNLKKGSINMGDYVLKMKGFADSLTAADQRTTAQDVILSVLNGLGLEYDPVVVHITSREDLLLLVRHNTCLWHKNKGWSICTLLLH